jgi:predicted TIM-barrel fold metal-dependent hydrolase
MSNGENNDAYFDAWRGGVVDLMLGIPATLEDRKHHYDKFRSQLHDKESREQFEFPAQYMFKDLPRHDNIEDPVEFLLTEMDRFNITVGMLNVARNPEARRALREHPDRFVGSWDIDPNTGMEGVRELERGVEEFGVRSAQCFPAGLVPQVPINDKKLYPYYAKCVELDIPMFINAGVPGPRVPMDCQNVAYLDEVCWYFPELKLVTRHGAEPWTALMAKLLLKWPNLYYSTSAFAPKHYPQDIIYYANTRGADKVMYSGYFPMGLTLDRIFAEMPNVPFRENVWPRFLRENARKVLKLDGA